ncbi:hypothetical protein AQUCO_03100035v1 [Aquilegia coerulea]|uniref:Uncharacterized protein n=1 Tax=Aquilegia coerulea TaxID=218851 RepID=A0A2G5D0H9_AQUCA|nr:hypothetical protein AQUCO_03100035v1 [Aquilegia coerulea]
MQKLQYIVKITPPSDGLAEQLSCKDKKNTMVDDIRKLQIKDYLMHIPGINLKIEVLCDNDDNNEQPTLVNSYMSLNEILMFRTDYQERPTENGGSKTICHNNQLQTNSINMILMRCGALHLTFVPTLPLDENIADVNSNNIE